MARYALVIGITQNQAPLQTLDKSAADARAIAAVLRDGGDFQVELLLKPEETTYKALAAKLKEFLELRALRHEALIYYTGHGFPVSDAFGEMEAFLAPSDCVVQLDADGHVITQEKGLSLTAVSKLSARAELSNLVMLLDCCHSGYLLEESLLKQTFITFIQKDYWLMTACRSFQSAYARRKDPYSIFTGAVLKGLESSRANDRGEITAGALFTFVAETLRGEKQEVMQLSVGRSIEIVRYPVVSEPAPAVVDETNPYQGLLAFTPETAQFFFGREAEIGQQQFIDCLTSVKQPEHHRLVVVTTMRADFIEPWLRSIELTAAIQNDALFLGALMGENLETAIEQPAAIQGYQLQPGLLKLILRDVAAEENSLPLLQFLLMQLWGKRDSPSLRDAARTERLRQRVKHELTVVEYENLGGLVGALDRHAESIYRELDARKQGEWVQRVMLGLVLTGEGVKDTRQRRSKVELLDMAADAATRSQIADTIERLVTGRLLVTDRAHDRDIIDLSHEALQHFR